ncbi:MAG TPA: RluA family pseudouridine synthase [Clostridiales bacterium]|nr:RluA family pseudouridine synthase [Clostridiales bacterium]
MKEFVIGKNDEGQRLDRFIGKAIPLLPPSLAQKYIRLKRIKVNGKGSRRDYKLALGDTLQCYINDEFFVKPSEKDAHLHIREPKLDIVYEDRHILLVNKPEGMLCHSAVDYSYNTLIAHIQAYLREKGEWNPADENSFAPALCNRIDRNTQGIVIAAKTAEALRVMNEKIKNREIDKFYLCIVHGVPKPSEGTLTDYIFKDASKNQVYVRKTPEKGAKKAVTKYKTLKTKNGLSLLECELVTGRTHQIRAQLAAAGHPLLGDGKYGRESRNKPYGESSQALCSYRLRFSFKTDAGELNYLNGREFSIQKIGFIKKYFE